MTILVTGATGNIGRKVVDHLLARGAADVRALTRSPRGAKLPDGVEVHTGFLGDLDSLDGVFDGVTRLYLAPYPDTVEQVGALAVAAGVQHIVDLSGPEDSHWGMVHEAVADSGVAFTHLEPGEFTENLTIWAEQIRTTRQVRDTFAASANRLITMDDIAEVAAVVLLSDGADGQVAPEFHNVSIPLAGPELLNKPQKVAAIADGLGTELEFVEVGRGEAVEILRSQIGEYAEWYVGVANETDDPEPEVVDAVPRITGRPATSVAEWVRANAETFH